MIQEARNLLNHFKVWLYLFGLLTVFFFATPSPLHSFSAMLIEVIKANMLTDDVQIIVTDPMNALSAQLLVALFLAFAASLPIFLWQLVGYLSPALYQHERSAALRVVAPSVVLFGAGAAFAYFVLAPQAIKFLYAYAQAVGAASFITAKQLVTFTLSMMVFTGVLFLLPVFMTLLTRLGLVPASFWRENVRYSIAGALILSAIITPDGSGVTMIILTIPLSVLYFIGLTAATRSQIRTSSQVAKRNDIAIASN